MLVSLGRSTNYIIIPIKIMIFNLQTIYNFIDYQMGQTNEPSGQKKQTGNPIAIATQTKEIILHYPYKLKLNIGYASTFPHNYEGLKLWDANIVLARYIVINSNKFKNMSVLELASGTGIAGIAVSKWTSAKKVAMSDTTDEVVLNIKNNCIRNKLENFISIKMSWNEYKNFNAKYDIILASDPFYHHCTPEILHGLANHFLEDGGTLIIAAPNSQKLHLLVKIAQQYKFEVKKEKINNEQYLNSPLLNQVEGEKEFPQVCRGEILIYEVVKRSPKPKIDAQTQKQKQLTEKAKTLQKLQEKPEKVQKTYIKLQKIENGPTIKTKQEPAKVEQQKAQQEKSTAPEEKKVQTQNQQPQQVRTVQKQDVKNQNPTQFEEKNVQQHKTEVQQIRNGQTIQVTKQTSQQVEQTNEKSTERIEPQAKVQEKQVKNTEVPEAREENTQIKHNIEIQQSHEPQATENAPRQNKQQQAIHQQQTKGDKQNQIEPTLNEVKEQSPLQKQENEIPPQNTQPIINQPENQPKEQQADRNVAEETKNEHEPKIQQQKQNIIEQKQQIQECQPVQPVSEQNQEEKETTRPQTQQNIATQTKNQQINVQQGDTTKDQTQKTEVATEQHSEPTKIEENGQNNSEIQTTQAATQSQVSQRKQSIPQEDEPKQEEDKGQEEQNKGGEEQVKKKKNKKKKKK